MSKAPKKRQLQQIYARLFAEDVEAIRADANEKGAPFQIELRLLVHEAVKIRRDTTRIKLLSERHGGK